MPLFTDITLICIYIKDYKKSAIYPNSGHNIFNRYIKSISLNHRLLIFQENIRIVKNDLSSFGIRLSRIDYKCF